MSNQSQLESKNTGYEAAETFAKLRRCKSNNDPRTVVEQFLSDEFARDVIAVIVDSSRRNADRAAQLRLENSTYNSKLSMFGRLFRSRPIPKPKDYYYATETDLQDAFRSDMIRKSHVVRQLCEAGLVKKITRVESSGDVAGTLYAIAEDYRTIVLNVLSASNYLAGQ